MIRIITVVALLSLTGCASIISGRTQSVTLNPMRDGAIDRHADCTASNNKGLWTAKGGNTVIVRKSSEDLRVACKDGDSVATAKGERSTQYGWAVANFFIWDLCTISCVVDFSTGAIYKYPEQVQLLMSPSGQTTSAALPKTAP